MALSPFSCREELKMLKAGWKIDQNEEACYITIDEDEEEQNPEQENEIDSNWAYLPDLLLEEIFSYLDIKERYYASLVCKHWSRIFYYPMVWRNFLVDDRTLSRTKYNYYSGWQYCLDHARLQLCLARVGRLLRGLEFRPEHSFNNIYQFMAMLSWTMDNGAGFGCPIKDVGSHIRSLVYVFPCSMSQAIDPEGIKLFGTGGQLLKGLKELLSRLKNLRVLKLIDFVLERYEANHLLDEVLEACCTKMRELNLVNVTTLHCPIMHVGLFLNLQILTISPQNLDDDTISLLADTKLRHLYILQNCYTKPYDSITPCSPKAWRLVKESNPKLQVHLRVEATYDGDVVFQAEAPVHSITYQTPKAKIKLDNILRVVDSCRLHLRVYGHEMLPKFTCPKSFQDRVDSVVMLLCRHCPNLHTLMLREKISTSTVLLIARTAQNLRHLYVRRHAVILRCDWPRNPDWTDEFWSWLQRCSRSYESVEQEVSQMLGSQWVFLNDSEYKQIEVDVRREL